MGISILVSACVFEVACMAYCITTKQTHNKARSWVRIAAFFAFVGGVLTPILDWGFRWYSLSALLAIFAAVGAGRLLTKRFGKRPYRWWRILFHGLAMLLLLAVATLPAIIFPEYESPQITGGYAIDKVSYTFTDTSRIEIFTNTGENRTLTVEFWYPKEGEGTYPLIVFSHGAFGVRMSNTSTFMELASNGYVVCSIDHPYHAAGTVDMNGNLTLGSRAFIQEVIDANSDVYSEKEQFELLSKWMDLRTGDIGFVLDTIRNNTQSNSDEVYSRIDIHTVGLIGHSLGGAACVQVGRVRSDIGAVIDLDGTMLGEYSINRNGDVSINDEPYPLPLLNFYSEHVINKREAEPEYVYPNTYISSLSSKAFEACIRGSNHMSYTDLPLFSPFLAKQLSGISGGSTKATVDTSYCIETTNTLVLEFFNCYLKGEGGFTAKEYY